MSLITICKGCHKRVKDACCGPLKFYVDYFPEGRNGPRRQVRLPESIQDMESAKMYEQTLRAASLESRKPGAVKQILSAATIEDLNIIIFPEGTRSTQLGEGRTGTAPLALHTGVKVVPVGCNNSDQLYPGSSPVAKSGQIIYRIGEPLCIDNQLKEFRIPDKFKLLSKESQLKYKDQFEGATRLIMLSISALLDEKYRRAFSGA